MSYREHYSRFLADCYDWVFGGFKENAERNIKLFRELKLIPVDEQTVLDLGCGSGFQSVPLAEGGYRVVGVDTSSKLLAVMKRRIGWMDVTAVEADLMDFTSYAGYQPSLAVCMGDTLSHLSSLEDVAALIRNVQKELMSGGVFLLTFRDMSRELEGADRFIPVQSSDNRHFTCFLEYGPDSVMVHDILNEKTEDGWEQSVSTYRKIRLGGDQVKTMLEEAGFTMEYEKNARGMVVLMGRKG